MGGISASWFVLLDRTYSACTRRIQQAALIFPACPPALELWPNRICQVLACSVWHLNLLQAKDAEASAATAQAAQLQEQAAWAAAQGDSAQAAQLHEAAAAATKEAAEAQQLAAIAFAEAGRPARPQAVQAAAPCLPETAGSVDVPPVPSQLQLVTSLSDSMQQTMKLLMAQGRTHGDMRGAAWSDAKALQSVAAWASPQAAVGPLSSGQTASVEGEQQCSDILTLPWLAAKYSRHPAPGPAPRQLWRLLVEGRCHPSKVVRYLACALVVRY